MLSIGIVGLPNVGKSTLFNALTKNSVAAENFPFCTIDPSVGVVNVKDERLDRLAKMANSAKTIYAGVEFVDIAGLVKGASKGEGLGNQFLSNIKEVDAIAHVVRVFDDSDIIHVEGAIDPMRDIEIINLELILADLELVSKRLSTIEKDIKRQNKDAIFTKHVLEKIMSALQEGKMARYINLNEEEKRAVAHLNLLTLKPMLYVLNKKADGLNVFDANDDRWARLQEFLKDKQYVELDASFENEFADLPEEDLIQLRREYNLLENSLDNLISTAYKLLGLISFFTVGEKEARAWTIKKGTRAQDAGAAIHSDFRDKFIRAETIAWNKLLEAGSKAVAREKGWIRMEGKDYIVQDGDVIEFLHS